MSQQESVQQIPLHHDWDATSSILQPYNVHLEAQVVSRSKKRRHSSMFMWPPWKRSTNKQPPDEFNPDRNDQDDTKLPVDPLNLYRLFKDKPGKELVESLIRCVTTYPPKPNLLFSSSDAGGPHLLSPAKDTTVSQYLDGDLVTALRTQESQYLQICAFVPPWTPESEKAFSFTRRLFASFGDRLHQLYRSPQYAIVHRVAKEWALDAYVIDVLKGLHDAHPRYPPLQLPSLKSRKTVPDVLSLHGSSMTLEWQAHPTKFKNDIDIYVWEYHLEPPSSVSVTIFILDTDSLMQRRVAVLFEPRELLHTRFTKLSEAGSTELIWPSCFDWQHGWAASHEVLHLILLFHDWMTADTAQFVDEVGLELRKMARRGRRWPSRSKVQYLIHLDDCRRKALEDLAHNAEMLKRVVAAVQGSAFCCKGAEDQPRFLSLLAGKQEDVKFLRKKVQGLAKPLHTMRTQINEQMNLSSGRRTFFLTLLAAIFIPLSFVSGIFGMNIRSPLFPSSSKPSKPANLTTQREGNSSAGAAPTIPTSITDILIHSAAAAAPTISAPDGPYLWRMALYLEIALPLAATTVILPLIIGSVIRIWVRTVFRYRLYWRAVYAAGALLYLGLVYGFLYYFSDDPCTFTETDDNCPLFWYYNRSYIAFVWYMVLIPGVLGSISVWTLYRAIQNNRKRKRWVLFALLVIGSIFAEVFVDYPALTSYGVNDWAYQSYADADGWIKFRPIPLTWIPWVFLLITWLWENR